MRRPGFIFADSFRVLLLGKEGFSSAAHSLGTGRELETEGQGIGEEVGVYWNCKDGS